MKQYYNNTTNEWYTEGDRITIKNSQILFSGIPTVEQLLEWGFEEYNEPEPTQEELLEKIRLLKLMELDSYDLSSEVNQFTINNIEMWLTVSERQLIATLISANESVGRENMTRWFGGQSFTFPLLVWKQMLTALEVYAGDALNVTEKHRAVIMSMQNIKDIEDYDFTTGYPDKLNF